MSQAGENPNILFDHGFVQEAFEEADGVLTFALSQSQVPGPECLAVLRNLTLEMVGAYHQFWALCMVENYREAIQEMNPQITELLSRMQEEVEEVLPARLEDAGSEQ